MFLKLSSRATILTALIGVFMVVGAPTTHAQSIVGSRGYPAQPDGLVSGFSPITASITATTTYVQYYLDGNSTGITHQIILRNSSDSADIDCASIPTTAGALGVDGGSPWGYLVTEALYGNDCDITTSQVVYARLVDGASNPQGSVAGITYWALYTGAVPDYTRFISTVPVYGATVATSTTIGATGFLESDDYTDDSYLWIRYWNQTAQYVSAVAVDALPEGSIEIPINDSGSFTLSTTTEFLRTGVYMVTYSVINPSFLAQVPILNYYVQGDTIISTSTKITVVQPTALDLVLASSTASLAEFLLTGTTTNPVLDCDFNTSFSLESCLVSLVIPPTSLLQQNFDRAKTLVFRSWPLGYVTRAIEIVTTQATSTLPTISYTFATSTALAGNTWNIDPWTGTASVINSLKSIAPVPKTAWDIVSTVIDLVIYLSLFIMIMHDITGVYKHNKRL